MDVEENNAEVVAAAEAVKQACSQLNSICEALVSSGTRLREQEEEGVRVLAEGYPTAPSLERADLFATLATLQEHVAGLQVPQVPAGLAIAEVLEALGKLQEHNPSPMVTTVAVACCKLHNATHSRLLALPDAALHSIAHCIGQHARLVCHQLCEAYGCPGTQLRWPSCAPPRTDSGSCSAAHACLPQLISNWRWQASLTTLVVNIPYPLQAAGFTAITTHLPNLRSLTCPWLQEAIPTSQLPPQPMSALTSLALLRVTPEQTPWLRPGSEMHAFVQLPALMPQLQRLSLAFSNSPYPDATFVSAMQQFGRHVSHLVLRRDEVFGGHAWSAAHCNDCLAGIAALAGSLRKMTVFSPISFSASFHTTIAALNQVTSLTFKFNYVLPQYTQLPSLRRLNLWDMGAFDCREGAALLVAWLTEGRGGGGLQELLLPDLDMSECYETWGPAALVAACALHTRLTALKVSAITLTQERRPSRWPAGLACLVSLRQLDVELDVEELNSTADWSVLTALTHLQLRVEAYRRTRIPDVVLQEAMQQGLGRLVGLQRVDLELSCSRKDDGALLRQWLLEALAGLPRLQMIGLAGALTDRDDVFGEEELAALAAGGARSRLRCVVLNPGYAGEVVAAVRGVLPWVCLEFAKPRWPDPW